MLDCSSTLMTVSALGFRNSYEAVREVHKNMRSYDLKQIILFEFC